jgi:hypothetical protein
MTTRKLLEPVQWLKNGDHPDDYASERVGMEKGQFRTWTGEEAKALGWEGAVVRYFRRPDIPGDSVCAECGHTFHVHGWIDSGGDGRRVCPGDWV